MCLALSACDSPFESYQESNDFFYDAGPSSYGPYLISKFSYLKGAFEESADHMEQALAHQPDNIHIMHSALTPFLLAGKFYEAEKLVQKLMGTKYEDELVRITHVTHLIGKQNYQEALRFLKNSPSQKEAFGLVTPLIELWLNQALKQEINTKDVTDLIEKSSTPEIYYYHLGNLYAFRNEHEKAKASYLKVLNAPNNISYREVEIISAYFKKHGDPEKAKAFIIALIHSQSDPYIYNFYADRLRKIEVPTTPLISIKKGIAEIYIQFAATLVDTVALDLAIVFLKLTHFLEPNFELEKALYASALLQRGLYNELISYLTDQPQNTTYTPYFILTEIDALLGAKQEEAAFLSVQDEIAKHPDWAFLYAKKGLIQTNLKKYADAVHSFTSAITLLEKEEEDDAKLKTEHLSNFYFLRGGAYERQDLWDLAEPDLERSLELKPNQPLVLNYLGYSWVDRGKNIENGLNMIRRALNILPHESAFLDSLGWAHFKLKNYYKAASYLEQALLISPDDPDSHDHLGDVYEAQGRLKEAKFEWKKALFFIEDPLKEREIEAKLKR